MNLNAWRNLKIKIIPKNLIFFYDIIEKMRFNDII